MKQKIKRKENDLNIRSCYSFDEEIFRCIVFSKKRNKKKYDAVCWNVKIRMDGNYYLYAPCNLTLSNSASWFWIKCSKFYSKAWNIKCLLHLKRHKRISWQKEEEEANLPVLVTLWCCQSVSHRSDPNWYHNQCQTMLLLQNNQTILDR